ncbi:MAG TPA: ferritin-like domain-containing protein, partial [Bryobacteraceae bacterium]|nr:ferritin-like domain-containing protein [Bryobacteraceae bacterium]
ARYNASIKLCAEVGDNASRELFVKLLKDEEEHVDFLESQLHLISEVGLERYLTEQIRG